MSMNALDALTNRVSGRTLVEPAPDELELHSLLSAAVRAPDHGRLRPWRFTVIRGDGLKQFGQIMADAYLKRNPDATQVQLEKERAKPRRAPLIVVVAAKVNQQSPIPAIEQVLAVAAAAQNIMVAAFALGFGCAWKTGGAAYADEVKAAFGLAPSDAIVGFMYLGSNESAPLAPPPLNLDDYVNEFAP